MKGSRWFGSDDLEVMKEAAEMKIGTERLDIIALTPRQFEWWINDPSRLERELGCSYRAELVEGGFKEILLKQLDVVNGNKENYLWHSFWFLVRKEDRVVVGSADFKELPDENGEVEIGYGLGAEFEHQGYMTEAVHAMCKWAKRQPGVKHVIAETDVDGLASQRILKRCGFEEYKRSDTVWWRL